MTARLLTIGRGGWTIYHDRKGNSTERTSGYGDGWRQYIDQMTSDAIGIDSTAMDIEDVYTYAVSGPIPSADLPIDTVEHIDRTRESWDPRPTFGQRDPRLGNARSMSYVSLDVYVEIAHSFGARCFSPWTGRDLDNNEVIEELWSWREELATDAQRCPVAVRRTNTVTAA